MSNAGERSELPTPKKLRDARAKGQVARSQEVVTTVSLLSIIGYLWVASGEITARLTTLIDHIARLAQHGFRRGAREALDATFWASVWILWPVLAIAILAAIAANYLQFGSVFAFRNIAPELEKLNPVSGFRRIFSTKNALESLKSIFKITLLAAVLYFVVSDAIGPFMLALPCGFRCIVAVGSIVLGNLFAYTALTLIAVAVADFAYQRHAYTKSLMMTKAEVKREYKESEGDPHIKSKRKQLAQEIILRDGAEAARTSTAVVINPTHLAVCLRYRPEEVSLPVVVAKGRNYQAQHLRTEAEEAGVPIFRNVALAQALFASADVDDFVPDELFEAVAEVLAWIERHKDKIYAVPSVIDMDAGDHRRP